MHATRMGFEPTRAEPNGLAVHRLNHSATSSYLLTIPARMREIFHSFYYLPAIDCGAAESVIDASLTFSNGTRLDAVTTYECDDGLRFWDGHVVKSIRCSENEAWSETGLDCLGKTSKLTSRLFCRFLWASQFCRRDSIDS